VSHKQPKESHNSAVNIHIIYGQQGAGKTTYALALAKKEQATRFSIDEWMSELYGPDLPQPLDFSWIMERVKRCEHRIWQTAVAIAEKGGSSILDLGFMKTQDRTRFSALAKDHNLATQLHFVTAPLDLRRQRVISRNKTKKETFAFEVSPQMFDFMEKQFEQPSSQELAKSTIFRTS